jgi:PLP dependent protein
MDSISTRIDAVRERIAAAARRTGRVPAEIRLVGVTKTHPPELIAQVIEAGLRDLGENRVQEAEPKIRALAERYSDLTWHLIGHLQSNKARRAAALFDMIHSVDGARLAMALDRHISERQDKQTSRKADKEMQASSPIPLVSPSPRLPILLQVNVSGEATKEGFDLVGWEELPELREAFFVDVERIVALPNLEVYGLMTIAPWSDDPEAARPVFRSTRHLRDELAMRFPAAQWSALSMGMTDDFEVAIEEGATIVRVGRAIFGSRQ